MTILLFLAVISLLVFCHELGHFLMAKKFGVGVEEFGFGIPPRVFGKRFGGTLYSLNLLPFGGFVKLQGDSADTLTAGPGGQDFSSGDLSFGVKSKPKRAAIILAGVAGNILLAWLIFTILFNIGFPRVAKNIRVEGVAASSPAEASQIKPGDYLLAVDGQKTLDPTQFSELIAKKAGTETQLTVQTPGGAEREITVTPRKNPPSGQGALGVKLGRAYYEKVSWWKSPFLAAGELVTTLKEMYRGFGDMLYLLVAKHEAPQAAGVVGLYSLTGEVSALGLSVFLHFIAIISLNLFIINVLPIPALDGGRLLFIGIEMVFGKDRARRWERPANNFGFAFLILLFVLVTFQDLRRMFFSS